MQSIELPVMFCVRGGGEDRERDRLALVFKIKFYKHRVTGSRTLVL